MKGWLTWSPEGDFAEHFKKMDAITTSRGCLLWGTIIIIPRTLLRAAHQHMANVDSSATISEIFTCKQEVE